MCGRHWRMVPRHIRHRVWAHYRDGQCADKRPSLAWMEAADDAIRAVWETEQARLRGKANGNSCNATRGEFECES